MTPTRTVLTDEQIRSIMFANGFTVKDGFADLKPYVYAAARAVEAATLAASTPAAPQADAADAARYRWLRDQPDGRYYPCFVIDIEDGSSEGDSVLYGADLDAKIDAALSAPTEPAKGDAL